MLQLLWSLGTARTWSRPETLSGRWQFLFFLNVEKENKAGAIHSLFVKIIIIIIY
jgi:hypothetical protein